MNWKRIHEYWPLFAIIFIMLLAFHTRLIDYRWHYLRNIDSYNFYREIEDIVNNGGVLPGYNPLLLAPYGSGVEGTIGAFSPYQYLAAYSFMFYKIFSPATQLWQFLIWFPALLAVLMAIPIYFIGKLLYDRKAGVLSAFFMLFNTSVMARTLGGDPDSDAIVLLLPLIIIALFLFVHKYTEKKGFDKKSIFYSILTGIVLGIWAYAWVGFWFVIWLITGFLVLKIIVNSLQSRNVRQIINQLKYPIYSFITILIVFLLLTIPFKGLGVVASSIQGPFNFFVMKSEETTFPNVYVSVAELQQSSGLKEIIQSTSVLGGPAILFSPFFLMIYCLIYLFYSYYKKRQHIDTLILIFIWFIGPLLATLVALRFSILFAAPLSISSGIIISKIYNMIIKHERFGD